MGGRIGRLWLALAVVGLIAAGCGNSGDDDDAAPTTTEATDTSTDDGDDGDGEDGRDTFVPIEGVPGVTDEEIGFAVIGLREGNPLGTCILDCYLDGINAYFAFRNDEGGIYGRELVVSQELDDQLTQNQVKALEVISGDKAFGSFNATLAASGWGDLNDAGIPTYVWGIHANEAAGREAIWPHTAVQCFDCTSRGLPYAAQEVGATKVASLGYGVTENSRVCAETVQKSFERYGEDVGVEFAYLNNTLDFGLPNGIGPEVSAMKEAGVDFISTCIDLNGMKTLATELNRQGMEDVVLYHPNTYNHPFVEENAELFEGDIVGVGFRPFEAEAEGSLLEDYLTWMEETGAEISELAMVGWINADLAFEGLLAAGPEFDRQKVIDATNELTEWNAGGLIIPIDWTRQHNPPTEGDPTNDFESECFAPVKIVDGAFETLAPPETPWFCWSNEDQDWSEPVPTNFE